PSLFVACSAHQFRTHSLLRPTGQSPSCPALAALPLLSAGQASAATHHSLLSPPLSTLPSRYHASGGDSFSHTTFCLAARLPYLRELFMILDAQHTRTNLALYPTPCGQIRRVPTASISLSQMLVPLPYPTYSSSLFPPVHCKRQRNFIFGCGCDVRSVS